MSNIIQKVKDAVTGGPQTTDNTHHTDSTHRGTTGTTGTGAVTSDTYDSSHRAGAHKSDAANKMDPRVDSDRDRSHKGETTWGVGGLTSGSHTGPGGYGSSHGSTNYGPHESNVANKLDPRVDFDGDRSHRVGGTGGGYSGGGYSGGGYAGHSNDSTLGQPGHGIVLNKPYDSTSHGTTGTGMLHQTGSTTAGPHQSDLANKVDPRVDSDRDGSHSKGTFMGGTGLGSTAHHDTSTHTAGPHKSDMMNKLDPRVDGDRGGSRNAGMTGTGVGTGTHHPTTSTYGTTGIGSGTHHSTAGPHGSDMMNKVDPRVDSDRDGSRNAGMMGTGVGTGTHHPTTSSYGTTGLGSTAHHDTSTHTAGPHKSDMMNKLDPRIDSDRGGSRNAGMTGTGVGTGTHHPTTGSYGTTGLGSTAHHDTSTHTAGPHKGDMMNKLDPTVDSDRGGSRNAGMTSAGVGTGTHNTGRTHDSTHMPGAFGHHDTTSTGTHQAAYGSTSTGRHDPRFDSDKGHHAGHGSTTATGTHSGGHTGGLNTSATGPAPNTAGPHKSDLLNKLDPRVDSDLDGSKTIGGNKTFSSTGAGTTGTTGSSTGTTGAPGRFA